MGPMLSPATERPPLQREGRGRIQATLTPILHQGPVEVRELNRQTVANCLGRGTIEGAMLSAFTRVVFPPIPWT